jgi:hypothetical protein
VTWGQGLFLAAVVIGGLLYLRWDIRRHPYVRCRWCKGSGKHFSVTRLRYGACHHCDGTGKRLGLLPRLFGGAR